MLLLDNMDDGWTLEGQGDLFYNTASVSEKGVE
jgi:hypothetical protein